MKIFWSPEIAPPQPIEDAPGILAGRTAWMITDGKVGMDAQARGVAEALGMTPVVKHVAPRAPWSWLAPWGPPDPKEAAGREEGPLARPWPDVAIACGRLSIPYIRSLRRRAGQETFTVVIQNPRAGRGIADLIAVPQHDSLTGDNVLVTLTAPNAFAPRRLAAIRDLPVPDVIRLPAPRFAVLLGGPNGAYDFDEPSLSRLRAALSALKTLGASFLITPSRRTPPELLAAVLQATEGAPRYVWDETGENPYPLFLAHADHLIATADSVNMVSEACATGRPVYVFEPAGGSPKFSRFHESLRQHGATRPLPATFDRLDDWQYEPLDSAAQIAREVERRWLARHGEGNP